MKKIKLIFILSILLLVGIFCCLNMERWNAQSIAEAYVKEQKIENYQKYEIVKARKKEDCWYIFFKEKDSVALGTHFLIVVNQKNEVILYPGE